MNLENLDLLSQKIESMLETLRRLKNEKADVEKALAAKVADAEAARAESLERAKRIETLEGELAGKDSELENLKAELSAKNSEAESLRATVAERDSALESVKASLSEKEAKLADMDKVVNEQGVEIQNAREKFQNLLSTIESELGTEIPLQSPEENGNGSEERPQASAGESAQADFFG